MKKKVLKKNILKVKEITQIIAKTKNSKDRQKLVNSLKQIVNTLKKQHKVIKKAKSIIKSKNVAVVPKKAKKLIKQNK